MSALFSNTKKITDRYVPLKHQTDRVNELNHGAQRNISYRIWYFDCRLNDNYNNNNGDKGKMKNKVNIKIDNRFRSTLEGS